jgi:fibronectin-binding autotransporter adhesin
MSLNPSCLVNSATPPVTASPTSTVAIALLSNTGVESWQLSVQGTDETNSATSLQAQINSNMNLAQFTTSFTMPAAGSAIIFRSTVLDGAGNSSSTTFKVQSLTSFGFKVGALSETTENDPTGFGSTAILNQFARTGGGGGGGSPTGSAGGDLGSTYPNPTVHQLTGTAGATSVLSSLQFSSTTAPVLGQVAPGGDTATDNFTVNSQAPYGAASFNKTPGNIVLNTPAPVGGASTGFVIVQSGGSNAASLAAYPGSPVSYSALWGGLNGVAPISNNVAAFFNSNAFVVNGYLAPNGTNTLGTSGAPWQTAYLGTLNISGNLVPTVDATDTLGTSSYRFSNIYSQLGLLGGTNATTAGSTMTIQAENAAGSNQNGGTLALQSGLNTGSGNPGDVRIQPGGTDVFHFRGDALGVITIADTTASFQLNQTTQSSISSGAGAAGPSFSFTAPNGQTSTHSGSNGGSGGGVTITAGTGGSPGSGGAQGNGGNVTLNAGNGASKGSVTMQVNGSNVIQCNSFDILFSASGNTVLTLGSGVGLGLTDGYVALSSGTTNLSTAQASYADVDFGTSSLTGNCTVVFPTVALGQVYFVDATGVVFNGNSITLKINSTAMSTSITSAALWLVMYSRAGKFYATSLSTT